MTRVETNTGSPVSGEQPRRRMRLPRLRLRLLIIVVVIGFAWYGLARLGAVWAPFVPTAAARRSVTPDTTIQSITSILSGSSDSNLVQSTITESTVTSWLRQQKGVPLTTSQVTIEPQDIEIYGHVSWWRRVPVTAVVVPTTVDGKTTVRVTSFSLGTVPLPTWLSGAFVGPMTTGVISQLLNPPHLHAELAFGKILISPDLTQ